MIWKTLPFGLMLLSQLMINGLMFSVRQFNEAVGFAKEAGDECGSVVNILIFFVIAISVVGFFVVKYLIKEREKLVKENKDISNAYTLEVKKRNDYLEQHLSDIRRAE